MPKPDNARRRKRRRPPVPTAGKAIAQLDLFQSANPDQSQAIEAYDLLPRWIRYGRRQAPDGRNIVVRRRFQRGGADFEVQIRGAILPHPSEEDTWDVVFPGTREEIVEDALRKLAVTGATEFDRHGGFVRFTLAQLRAELRERGHSFSYAEIKESLLILHGTQLTLIRDGETMVSDYVAPSLGISSQRGRSAGADRCVIRFHPLVTQAIQESKFRHFNYAVSMALKNSLARSIFKRLSMRWRGADLASPYGPVKLSTILREAGEDVGSSRANNRKLKRAIDELTAKGVIRDVEMRQIREGRQIVDAHLRFWAAERYAGQDDGIVQDIIEANAARPSPA